MRFLRGIWRFLVGVKDALVLLLLLLFFGSLYAALSMRPTATVPQGSALTLNLAGTIVDQATEEAPLTLVTGGGSVGREIVLRDVIRAVDNAAADKRIKGIVLDLDGMFGAGQAHLQAIGGALDRFRRAGKPIYAYASAYTDDSYYLAVHANEIWLNPLGGVLVTGPGGSNLYFKALLDKLGVEVEVFRVGTYKSYVEPFTRNDQSPEAREAAQALADTLWTSWTDDVARARPTAALAPYLADLPQRLSAAGGDLGQAALGARLVDRLGDRTSFARRVAEIVGDSKDKQIGRWSEVKLADYAAATAPSGIASGPAVGVVYVTGAIVDGEAPAGTAGGDTIAALVEDALTNKDIKALVVRVDSPGGSVLASERIRGAVVRARAAGLPVVASMGSVAASGGYWVSTAAGTIFAEPATITGSIGVFGIIPTFKATLDKIGVSADGVSTTPYSGQPDPLRGLTPEVRQILQLTVENSYNRFLALVARARNMTPAAVDNIAQGRVWAGATARQIGLVDRFGGLGEAVAEAARQAKLDPAGTRILVIEKTPSLPFQMLRQWFVNDEGEQGGDALASLARSGQHRLLAAATDAASIAGGATIQARCLECTIATPPTAPAGARSWLATAARGLLE